MSNRARSPGTKYYPRPAQTKFQNARRQSPPPAPLSTGVMDGLQRLGSRLFSDTGSDSGSAKSRGYSPSQLMSDVVSALRAPVSALTRAPGWRSRSISPGPSRSRSQSLSNLDRGHNVSMSTMSRGDNCSISTMQRGDNSSISTMATMDDHQVDPKRQASEKSRMARSKSPVELVRSMSASMLSLFPTIPIPREGPAPRAAAPSIAGKVAGKHTTPWMRSTKKYQIVLVTSELAPYSKTGGLGEAMDGLSVALAALGHRVMVITPRYDQYADAWDTGFWSTLKLGGKEEKVHFFHSYKNQVDHVFVDHPCFLATVWGQTGTKLYGPEFGQDWADNQVRFAYFCKAALVAIQELPLAGYPYGDDVVVVANDWHAGLVPMLIQAQRELDPNSFCTNRTKVVSLTHNAVYQGRFQLGEGLGHILGVSQKFVNSITFNMPIQPGQFNKKEACVNHLAAGLVWADRVLTVSPTYAAEISTLPEKGVELQDLYRSKKCTGILNGIKEAVSPLNDIFLKKARIPSAFSIETVDKAKAEMKRSFQEASGLPESKGPLMCFIGRLDVQKGYDLIVAALEQVLPQVDMQLVVIGNGRSDLVTRTKELAKEYPGKISYEGWMGPERYALLAACDYTVFFSRWEPCGLVQMECMRLGTVPVVAPTGGLKDTIEDGKTGFFTDKPMADECEVDKASVASIVKTLRKVSDVYTRSPKKVSEMRKASMAAAEHTTWTNAALQYEAVFEDMGAVDVLSREAGTEGGTVTLQDDKIVC